MEQNKKMSTLIKPQAVNKSELVEGYCGSNYSNGPSGTACGSNYSCGPNGVSSTYQDDDILV